MASIEVPYQVFPGFKIIGNLSEKQISKVTEYFQNMEVGEFFGDVADNLGKITKDDGDQILHTIVSFMELTVRDNSEIAKELAESYAELSKTKINNRLKSNLLKILNNYNKLKFSNTIQNHKVENSNNYGISKIRTDIRLVPDLQNLVEEEYGVVIHKLLLEYRSGSKFKELHLSLDIQDLITLRDLIDKSIIKDEILRNEFKGNIKLV